MDNGVRSFADEMGQCTIRICVELDNNSTATGTGFFFNLPTKIGNVPLIITNRHVAEGSLRTRLRFHLADKNWVQIPDEQTDVIADGVENRWVFHPTLDLAALPLQPLRNKYDKHDRILFSRSLTAEHILDERGLNDLLAIEEVIMTGYPLGIWDSKNNAPVIRKGITATAPYRNYEGRNEFLIDMACFPGSSGSPVCLFNSGGYLTRDGSLKLGSRGNLLGILYAGPMYNAKGELIIKEIPTNARAVASTDIPCNLGYVIKAAVLFDFAPIFEKLV